VEQNFTADMSDPKWVSDITYIWAEEGWLYLSVVLELYSRRVMGWTIGERMTDALDCKSFFSPVGIAQLSNVTKESIDD